MDLIDFNINGFLSSQIHEWSKTNDLKNIPSYILCIELNKFSQEILYDLKIHNEDPQELLVSTLFLRSLEIYQGSIISIEKGMLNNAKILARSYLEILFKLRAISISSKLAIDFIRQHYIKVKKYKNKLNNLSPKIKSQINFSENSDRFEEMISEIEKLNIKEHGIVFYAEKANLMDLYNTAYSLFSDQVHSNVSDLESYLVIENKKVVSFSHGPQNTNADDILDTLNECMIYTLEDINSTFRLELSEKVKSFGERSNKIIKNKINQRSNNSCTSPI